MLSGLRIAVGVGAYTAPNLTGKAFGLDPVGNPQASFMGRLFGVRDLALGAGTMATSAESRRLWLQLGVLCDAADALSAVLAARRGVVSKPVAGLLAAPAIAAVGMGVAALASE
jgi:hypothetical protein